MFGHPTSDLGREIVQDIINKLRVIFRTLSLANAGKMALAGKIN